MSSTATLERFPKTVSACHVEIIRLRKQLEESNHARVHDLEAAVKELDSQIDAKCEEIGDLEERVKELEDNELPDLVDAVDNFLYQVDRPAGQFKFDVIHDPATDRAIVRLFDAVGRQP